jgi:hypothetical protein
MGSPRWWKDAHGRLLFFLALCEFLDGEIIEITVRTHSTFTIHDTIHSRCGLAVVRPRDSVLSFVPIGDFVVYRTPLVSLTHLTAIN